MNYRHAFHAGNFADVFKHAVLLELLSALTQGPPLRVVDTHAGAGLYDLAGEAAQQTGEASDGVERLLAAHDLPEPMARLARAVRLCRQSAGAAVVYPGSPWLIARALRREDRYVGYELRGDDAGLLRRALAPFPSAKVREADGWAALTDHPPRPGERTLVLIDPPFEAATDGRAAAALAGDVLARDARAVVAIWAPIKDLAGFDDLRTRIEDACAPIGVDVAELRLRALSDPLRLNGCAMLIAGAPPESDTAIETIAHWCAQALGEAGAVGRLERGTSRAAI